MTRVCAGHHTGPGELRGEASWRGAGPCKVSVGVVGRLCDPGHRRRAALPRSLLCPDRSDITTGAVAQLPDTTWCISGRSRGCGGRGVAESWLDRYADAAAAAICWAHNAFLTGHQFGPGNPVMVRELL